MALTKIDDRGLKTPIDLLDNEKIRFGTGNDLEITHNGTNSHIDNHTGDLNIRGGGGDIILSPVDGEFAIYTIANNKVQLRYDNSTKLETTSTGIYVDSNIRVGTSTGTVSGGNALIMSGAAGSRVKLCRDDSGVGNSDGLEFIMGADATTYIWNRENSNLLIGTNGTERLRITSSGNVNIAADSKKLQLGASQDLELYHDATNTHIDNNTGHLFIRNNVDDDDGGNIYIQAKSQENSIVVHDDGAVELHYDGGGNSSFKTTSYGSYTSGQFRINNWSGSQGLWVGRSDADPGAAVGVQVSCDSTKGFIKSYGSNLRIQIAAVDGTASNAIVIDQATKDADFYGNINVLDDKKLLVGTGDDLQIYHDGTYSQIQNLTGDLLIKNDGTNPIRIRSVYNEENIVCYANGTTELYYDGTKKLETTSTGVTVNGAAIVGGNVELNTDAYLKIGESADVFLAHTGGNSYLQNATGFLFIHANDLAFRSVAQENYIVCDENAEVELYYDGSKKLETISGGISVTGGVNTTAASSFSGNIHFGDSVKANFGGDDDLQIYHDGTNNYIKHVTTGAVYLETTTNLNFRVNSNENAIIANANGAVELYHDNAKKVETTAAGMTISGPEGGDAVIQLNADEGDDNNDKWRILSSAANNEFFLQSYGSGSWTTGFFCQYNTHIQEPLFKGPLGGIKFDADLSTPTSAQWGSYDGDGHLHRSNGQAYLTVDDYFRIRDLSNAENKRFEFQTDTGNAGAQNDWNNDQFDFAEFFEWSDGNPNEEDRIGNTVAVDGLTGKIKIAEDGDTVIGVVSGTAAFTGNAGMMGWQGQYLRDEWGRYIFEDNTNKDGTPGKKFKVNPDFDPTKEYQTRNERKEWDKIGIIGQCYVRKTAVKPSSWIKLKEVDSTKDFYLIK